MAPFTLLEEAEENSIHKTRLLHVEEKTFKRLTKRLLALSAPTVIPSTLPPTTPPGTTAADAEAASSEGERQRQLEARRQFREDVLLDFAAYESTIVRMQFLFTTNIKERERYATQKVKIQDAAQAVKDNTADLRVQLKEAQRNLALRKEYDVLAEKITSNRSLKPRAEQHHNIEKLHTEIAELEREREDYAHTWAERREQFGKIIEEGMHLRRLIRDEKEEVERREGMEGQEDGEREHKGGISDVNTPRSGGATPMHGVEKEGGTGTPSKLDIGRSRSPLREMQLAESEERKDDEEMAEDGELAGEPEGTTAAPIEGLVEDPDNKAIHIGSAEMDVT